MTVGYPLAGESYFRFFSPDILAVARRAGDEGVTLSAIAAELGLYTSARLLRGAQCLAHRGQLFIRRDVWVCPPDWRFWHPRAISDDLLMTFRQQALFTPPADFSSLDFFHMRSPYDRKFAKVPTKGRKKVWVIQEA